MISPDAIEPVGYPTLAKVALWNWTTRPWCRLSQPSRKPGGLASREGDELRRRPPTGGDRLPLAGESAAAADRAAPPSPRYAKHTPRARRSSSKAAVRRVGAGVALRRGSRAANCRLERSVARQTTGYPHSVAAEVEERRALAHYLWPPQWLGSPPDAVKGELLGDLVPSAELADGISLRAVRDGMIVVSIGPSGPQYLDDFGGWTASSLRLLNAHLAWSSCVCRGPCSVASQD